MMTTRRARRWGLLTAAGSLVVLMGLAVGCSTVVVAPAEATVSDPVTVLLVDYGRHSSLVLPSRASPDSDSEVWTEFAFGERSWYAENDTSTWSAVRLMVTARPSTFGRRDHVMARGARLTDWEAAFAAERVYAFRVSRQRMEALRARLEARHAAGASRAQFNAATGLVHVDDGRSYNLFVHNCNHETAEWLEELGCEVSGPLWLAAYEAR